MEATLLNPRGCKGCCEINEMRRVPQLENNTCVEADANKERFDLESLKALKQGSNMYTENKGYLLIAIRMNKNI